MFSWVKVFRNMPDFRIFKCPEWLVFICFTLVMAATITISVFSIFWTLTPVIICMCQLPIDYSLLSFQTVPKVWKPPFKCLQPCEKDDKSYLWFILCINVNKSFFAWHKLALLCHNCMSTLSHFAITSQATTLFHC